MPEPAAEVFGKARRVHLDLHPSVADLDLKESRRRLSVIEAIAIDLPGHPNKEVAWLGFDPSRDLDDRVQLRNPKTTLQQTDLRTVQARPFGDLNLGEVRPATP
jgi:hypothetical protein